MFQRLFTLLSLHHIAARWRAHATVWQQRRIPAGAHLLNARSVFILPTRQGVYLALFLVAMLLACINYNLSLGYMLTFFVFAIALGAMSRTHQNLLGLRCELLPYTEMQMPVFAGQTAQISLQLSNTSRLDKLAIDVQFKQNRLNLATWSKNESENAINFSLASNSARTLTLPLLCPKRGLHAVPALTLASVYPLGLWRAWSYLFNPSAKTHGVWVFPAPRTPLPIMPSLGKDRSETAANAPQMSAQGDSVSHIEATQSASARSIHWPSIAKGLLAQRVLDGETQSARQVQLGFSGCTVHGLEAQLEQLCAGVLHCQAHGIHFTLHLGGGQTLPLQGDARCDSAHVLACLQALAIYE